MRELVTDGKKMEGSSSTGQGPTVGCSASGRRRIGTSTTQLKRWKYALSRLRVSALAMGQHQVYTNVVRCCTGVFISSTILVVLLTHLFPYLISYTHNGDVAH
jgi:hypothetical protein